MLCCVLLRNAIVPAHHAAHWVPDTHACSRSKGCHACRWGTKARGVPEAGGGGSEPHVTRWELRHPRGAAGGLRVRCCDTPFCTYAPRPALSLPCCTHWPLPWSSLQEHICQSVPVVVVVCSVSLLRCSTARCCCTSRHFCPYIQAVYAPHSTPSLPSSSAEMPCAQYRVFIPNWR